MPLLRVPLLWLPEYELLLLLREGATLVERVELPVLRVAVVLVLRVDVGVVRVAVVDRVGAAVVERELVVDLDEVVVVTERVGVVVRLDVVPVALEGPAAALRVLTVFRLP